MCHESIDIDCHVPKLQLARVQFPLPKHLFPKSVLNRLSETQTERNSLASLLEAKLAALILLPIGLTGY